MGYLNIPANGWPQLKDLEKLDKIAQQMVNLPTFTSDDRTFLEALPAMPTEEGKRVLTATTDDQGETDLTYETPDVEGADIAPTFSESVTYPAGTLVYYDGILYKFTEDHAAGTWNPSEVTTSSVSAELIETNSAVDELKNTFTYSDYSLPAFSYAAGSVGTFIDMLTVNAAKTGYRIVSVTLTRIDHPGDYTVKLSAFNNTTIYAYLYRSSTSSGSYSAGEMTIRVLYKKI